ETDLETGHSGRQEVLAQPRLLLGFANPVPETKTESYLCLVKQPSLGNGCTTAVMVSVSKALGAPLVTARNWTCGQGCGKGREGRVGLGEQDQDPSLQRKLEIPDYEFGPFSMAKCRWGW
uniref:Uncharacterized protein n=1 Tax=Aquila chrysaetos chrysaetos TaxID=223781 RepID=A0A663F411_AQUCH